MENTIKEHELLAKHEANIEEIFHQLGEVKAEVRDIRKLTSAVEKLATQTATLTMPYTAKIHARCRVWRTEEADDESAAWDVVSVNNVEDANKYLEVLIQKPVKG